MPARHFKFTGGYITSQENLRPMKTTPNIGDALLSQAKAFAAQQHTTLTRWIEEGLQLCLRIARGLQRAIQKRRPVLLVYAGRGGLVAGVDPLSNQAVLNAADK